MKLHSPFLITARLAPGIKIGDVYLSFDGGRFVFDFHDGSEYVVTDFNFPRCRIAGKTDERFLQDGFAAILGFLGACAESRKYARRMGRDEMEGENSDLFPPHVGEWAESVSDEISMLECELDESETDLIED